MQYKYLEEDYFKIAIKLKDRAFVDPYEFDFNSRYVLSNLNERDFTYKNDVLKIPTRNFLKGKAYRGYTLTNKMPNQSSYRKRKLVLVDENKVLVCRASDSTYWAKQKKSDSLQSNKSGYQAMLGEKLCDQLIKNPLRKIKALEDYLDEYSFTKQCYFPFHL